MRRIVMLLVLAALAPASAALALSIPVPPVPATLVHAGGEYRTAPGQLPGEAREVELFLVPDDGTGRMIRLTAERDAGERQISWRMPPIAARRARLVLRAGGPGGEWESAPSAPFEVAPRGPGEALRLRRGLSELGWRFGERTAPGASALFIPPGREAIGDAPRGDALSSDTRIPAAARPSRTRVPYGTPVRGQSAACARPVLRNAPAFVPMLI